jgi:hypothetical protein
MWAILIVTWLAFNIGLVVVLWRAAERKGRRAQREADDARGGDNSRHVGQSAASLLGLGTARADGHPSVAVTESAPAATADREMRRVVMLVGGTAPEDRRADDGDPLAFLPACAAAEGGVCRAGHLHAEIRSLRLTVAELSLERAKLSSAMARRRG